MHIRFFAGVIFILGMQFSIQAQSTEWIKAYFNMPAVTEKGSFLDQSINDGFDLIGTLETLIDSATTSIDLCIYDLEHPRIGEALVRAKKRGLRVRLVTDDHNRTDSRELDAEMWKLLGDAGIFSLDDDGDIYQQNASIADFDLVNNSADMHNKFAVIDRLSPTTNDDIVWTGSTNLTYTGAYNTNNVLIIKDAEVALLYEQEFEQMWGSSGETADPFNARFHKDKSNLTPSVFDVDGTKIEIYFAPQNREKTKPSISDRLVELIQQKAQHDIKFQAFSFTPTIPLAEAIWNASSDSAISLQGVIDPGFFSRYRNASQIWGSKEAQSGNRMILPARETRKLHHKVLLIDAEHPDENEQAIVVTGSYNFSNNAEFNNDENLIVIHSDEIAAQYLADFQGAFARAKGELEAPAPPINSETWYEVYAIRDGREFEIEVLPGFGYPVRLLGARVPSIFAGTNSSDYFAGPAAEYLRNILEGRKVKISVPGKSMPDVKYGAYYAYVSVDFDGIELPLNKTMLKNGYATFSDFLPQHPDSVNLFKKVAENAENNREGIWKRRALIGTKVARQSELSKTDAVDVVYPININTADRATLQLLPGIGETYAKRIIEYREQNGGFDTVEELLNIKGIGERRLERLRPVVTL
ncbi:MAG: helix-hairpin-helix domain-containing protein [Balneolaceae bacterium]|nr:helix-hairpin-helix domain-containing protein [Balneolaceae bacterium]